MFEIRYVNLKENWNYIKIKDNDKIILYINKKKTSTP